MFSRRKFLQVGSLGLGSFSLAGFAPKYAGKKPIVLSTWDAGIRANKAAWNVLKNNGRALDAVEQGVMVTENEMNCCVGLGANPDRDGFVTLDASIMDENANCGSVACLERIKHPISVARKVMENTPHVMLVGQGAQQFALSQGFTLEKEGLSEGAEREYKKWLQKSEYKPAINRENKENRSNNQNEVASVSKSNSIISAPARLSDGSWNHDTIGMIALDAHGNLSGSCTTSGMGFKMRGRVGDSPIIGAGLFVDNEVGAVVATGQGEDIIRIGGAHAVMEFMRQGLSPEMACKKAVERLLKVKGAKAKEIQACMIAINKDGVYGGYALQKGFNYAVCYADDKNILVDSKFLI